jgi:hypothetical protein
MNAEEILAKARRYGVELVVLDGRLKASPPGVLPADMKGAIREQASDIKARLLATDQTEPPPAERPAEARATWPRYVTPDSRNPLIPLGVRQKIEAIESDARAKGWPAELLYNANFWDSPRGLAAVLDADDEIVEVTPDQIAVLKVRRDLLRFRRHVA